MESESVTQVEVNPPQVEEPQVVVETAQVEVVEVPVHEKVNDAEGVNVETSAETITVPEVDQSSNKV